MSIEATHLNIFPTQFIPERDLVSQENGVTAYNTHQMQFYGVPSTAAWQENQLFYKPAVYESVQTKTSGNNGGSKKRSRASFDAQQNFVVPQKCNGFAQLPSLAVDDIMSHIHQYQFEIDDAISQHTKKIKFLFEERQKYETRLLATAICESMMKKLKLKDEQIQRIAKLNLALQDKMKSLYAENQQWRDLAQIREATANSLRSNLEQVLHRTGAEQHIVAEEAQSFCGSTNGVGDNNNDGKGIFSVGRMCRICREKESSVLLLPCRHLCLCNVCWSGSQQLQSCPVCNATMTATLHVNMA